MKYYSKQHILSKYLTFTDEDYVAAGAKILPTIEATYDIAEMIIKVKEPIEREYNLVKKDQLVFTYFHFASYEPLTHAMIKNKSVCLAYETVEKAVKLIEKDMEDKILSKKTEELETQLE